MATVKDLLCNRCTEDLLSFQVDSSCLDGNLNIGHIKFKIIYNIMTVLSSLKKMTEFTVA